MDVPSWRPLVLEGWIRERRLGGGCCASRPQYQSCAKRFEAGTKFFDAVKRLWAQPHLVALTETFRVFQGQLLEASFSSAERPDGIACAGPLFANSDKRRLRFGVAR